MLRYSPPQVHGMRRPPPVKPRLAVADALSPLLSLLLFLPARINMRYGNHMFEVVDIDGLVARYVDSACWSKVLRVAGVSF